MAAKNKKEEIGITEEAIKKILALMGTKAEASVSFDEENEAVVVDIETGDETGLLIGHRGETLNAIQAIIGMIIRQRKKEWTRVIVNIGDWRAKQEDYLKGLAAQAAERARETSESQTLYNLTPAQRRTIHLFLAEEKDVETESHGIEGERYLVVKIKGSKT